MGYFLHAAKTGECWRIFVNYTVHTIWRKKEIRLLKIKTVENYVYCIEQGAKCKNILLRALLATNPLP